MRTQKEIDRYCLALKRAEKADAQRKVQDEKVKPRSASEWGWYNTYVQRMNDIRMHMFKSGPRFKVGDKVWHYGTKGVERGVIEKVCTTTTDNGDFVNYVVQDRKTTTAGIYLFSFRHAGEVFATRKEAREAEQR